VVWAASNFLDDNHRTNSNFLQMSNFFDRVGLSQKVTTSWNESTSSGLLSDTLPLHDTLFLTSVAFFYNGHILKVFSNLLHNFTVAKSSGSFTIGPAVCCGFVTIIWSPAETENCGHSCLLCTISFFIFLPACSHMCTILTLICGRKRIWR
jgi:hypothetical protein